MKHFAYNILFLLFLCTANKSYAQLLYLQENYKGGISVDGKSYYGENYLASDTINFLNTVPTGSIVKKAFLLSCRLNSFVVGSTSIEVPLNLNFNGNNFTMDSSDIVTSLFYCAGITPAGELYMVSKDVTNYVVNNNNKLIIPCQGCGIKAGQTVYNGFLLIILYENNAMPATNVAMYLNDKTYFPNMMYNFSDLSPINTNNDVGLSIWTNDVQIEYPINFILNSSIGNFNLGSLWFNESHLSLPTDELLVPGSFYYENNTLLGLRDDSPDAFIDSTDALANIKTYITNNATTFSLSTTLTTDAGCLDGIFAYILAYATPCPVGSIKDTTIAYSICSGSSKQLIVSSNTTTNTYNWYATDGSLTTATTASVTVTPTVNTTYYVYIDSAGCKQMQRFAVTVNPSPKFDTLYKNNAVCGGALGTLTISPAYGGTTMGGPYHYGINMGNQTGNIFTNIAVGAYTATVADAIGCKYAQTFTITEVNNAAASFSISPNSVCINEPVELINTSTGTNLQWWSFGTAVADTSNTKSPAYVYTDTGSYQVILIAYNNLRTCSDTLTKTITVKDCPPDSIHITVPNIFSPNADGINDAWQLIVYNYQYTVSNCSCIVYDRWGLKVFSTANISEAWDGRTTSGMPCSAGTYYYTIKLTATNSKGVSEVKDFKGFLELVR